MQKSEATILPFNNPLIRFMSEPGFRWLRHTLFICLGLILAFKGDIENSGQRKSQELYEASLIVDCLSFCFILGMIYFVVLYLVPRLLFKSKVFLFAICFWLTLSLLYIGVWFLDYHFLQPLDTSNPRMIDHLDFSFITYIQVSAVGAVLLGSVVGLVIFKKWINDVKQMHELQQANLRTELEQLKSQVNPHFLFNTLNSLHVLMKTDTNKASQVLLGLSDLLRYQLYDSSKERILLSKDIIFIENLLALEKIRMNDFEYEIHVNGNIENVSMPPFLFIPFVENAIKHGATSVGHSFLKLYFNIKGKQLEFTSENSKPPVKKDQPGGLGLKNIRRRLELLYPNNHQLSITDDKYKYLVHLNLPL